LPDYFMRRMQDNKKTQEFLQKLAPCVERGELEKYVEEAARVAVKYLPDFLIK